MPAGDDGVAIVGGGLAGFTTAQELRKHGYDGRVTIIDPEGVPYDRPPLSKEYLDGSMPLEKLSFVPDSWYSDNAVELVTDRVTALRPDEGVLELAGGSTFRAGTTVLTLGGRARRLPIPGGDLPGLLQLRTKADADTLRGLLKPGVRLAIIGAGLIGAEVASTAVKDGATVSLIDPVPVPLVPLTGAELAVRLHAMHAAHGVDVRCAMTTAIRQSGAEYTITLNDGSSVVADAVLVAVGIVPETHLAETAGLATDQGILVDEAHRTTNPGVYAAGDVARIRRADGTVLRRHEHWESAMHGGQNVAAAIVGKPLPEHGAAWMWSDRYGVHVEAVGDLVNGTPIVRYVDGVPVAAFRMEADGRMIGAATLDGGTAVRAARRIIDRGLVVDPIKLADPAIELKKLAR
ncbi:NAD(P)/FAD-dependent oxidoreductase [Raineyella fluvialis]|uniref:NAD(P)-binding protein n=1 Tax=Raineyella fluvialis TaxID=2662261 RepID=A0A5Q2F9B1_9ACTN|nr:FAD-dependent oxidoreductase [Raineyella fluvialis]QGF23550.1 NAD(P)-binding protein [Raineyella fluvialis]